MGFFDIFRKKSEPVINRVPQTITEALQQDARPRQLRPVASISTSPGYFIDTRASGGKSVSGLSKYEKHLVIDHWATRQNMRYALNDSPPARTIVKRKNDSVVGNGLILDPTPDGKILGKTEKSLEKWSNNVKSRFHLWAKSKKSDITGRNNFYQNTRLYGWQYGRDGDVFMRLHYSDDPNLINPLQISFIDPNQIRGDEFTFSLGPIAQRDGIEKDENGKEIAYLVWIEDQSRPGRYRKKRIPAFDEETGRPLMIHGFDPEWAGQSRGYPGLSHALQAFEDMESYTAATAKKMVNSAEFGFTVENQLQDPSDMGIPSLISSGVEQVQIDQSSSPSQTPRTFSADSITACTVSEATMSESGVYHLLGAAQGDKLVQIKMEGPAETSAEFNSSRFMFLSATAGLPSSVALMKFDKSHAASRGELGILAANNEIVKDDIDADMFSVVYGAWMAEEIAKGNIRAPGFSSPLLREAWLCHVIIGHPLPDIDPDKTMSAKQKALSMCLTDLDREAMLYNGSSGSANRAKMARQVEELPTDPFDLEEPEPKVPEIDEEENVEE